MIRGGIKLPGSAGTILLWFWKCQLGPPSRRSFGVGTPLCERVFRTMPTYDLLTSITSLMRRVRQRVV